MGCPIPVMNHHIRLSAIEFCNKTRWHEDECAVVDADPGRFVLQPDAGLEVASISRVYVDGLEVHNKTRQSGLALLNTGSLERFYCVVSDGEIAINPEPAAGASIRVVVTLRPAMAANVISEDLNEWRDGIASGAVARIAALPAQAFTSADMVVLHGAKFDEAVRTAKVKKSMGSSETAQKRVAEFF
jgi:hypothetical protein